MQCYNDSGMTVHNENSLYEYIAFSTVGDREEQQDSFGYNSKENELLVVVCDGMGGHACGAEASRFAVNDLLNELSSIIPDDNIPEKYLKAFREADKKISSFRDENNKPLGAGTTAISVLLRNDLLYWCSVGDSRIYLMRGEEIIQVTCDHTYKFLLDNKLSEGEISLSEYEQHISEGNALVSFLGVGVLPFTDLNNEPFRLIKDDKILLMSDGLYKYISDADIKNIMFNFRDLNDVVEALESKVKRGARKLGVERDNMTVFIVRVKENW